MNLMSTSLIVADYVLKFLEDFPPRSKLLEESVSPVIAFTLSILRVVLRRSCSPRRLNLKLNCFVLDHSVVQDEQFRAGTY